jgi:hypothetical protein
VAGLGPRQFSRAFRAETGGTDAPHLSSAMRAIHRSPFGDGPSEGMPRADARAHI